MASINHGSIGKKMSPSTQDGMIGTKITSQSAKVIKIGRVTDISMPYSRTVWGIHWKITRRDVSLCSNSVNIPGKFSHVSVWIHVFH